MTPRKGHSVIYAHPQERIAGAYFQRSEIEPKDLGIHLLRDTFDVVSTELLVRFDELVEVPLAPIREPLGEELFLLPYFQFGQSLGFVDLFLLLLLTGRVAIFGHLRKMNMADTFPISTEDFFL